MGFYKALRSVTFGTRTYQPGYILDEKMKPADEMKLIAKGVIVIATEKEKKKKQDSNLKMATAKAKAGK